MKRIIAIVCLFSCVQVTSHAADAVYDRIHLSASAQQKVENDTLVVTLYAQEEGRAAVPLTHKVNENIRWGVELIKKDGRFKVQTGSYATYPVYHNNKISGWRVRQTLVLEGKALEQASEILGELQKRLSIQGMHFTVSAPLRDRTDDALINEALAAFRHRAEQVVREMGRKDYRIVQIRLDTSGGQRPYPAAGGVVMMEKSSGPAVASGEQVVRVTARGTIELEE